MGLGSERGRVPYIKQRGDVCRGDKVMKGKKDDGVGGKCDGKGDDGRNDGCIEGQSDDGGVI